MCERERERECVCVCARVRVRVTHLPEGGRGRDSRRFPLEPCIGAGKKEKKKSDRQTGRRAYPGQINFEGLGLRVEGLGFRV